MPNETGLVLVASCRVHDDVLCARQSVGGGHGAATFCTSFQTLLFRRLFLLFDVLELYQFSSYNAKNLRGQSV